MHERQCDNDNCDLCHGFPDRPLDLLADNLRMSFDIVVDSDDQMMELLSIMDKVEGICVVDVQKLYG